MNYWNCSWAVDRLKPWPQLQMLFQTYCLILCNGEPVWSQTMQNLMIQEFLLYWIIQVHVLVKEQMFLKEEQMMLATAGCCTSCLVGCGTCCTVPFPLRHHVCHFLLWHKAALWVAQDFINSIACRTRQCEQKRQVAAQCTGNSG